MNKIKYLLSFVSPFMLFAFIFVMASGVKSEPMNLTVIGWGLLGVLFALVTFPRKGHPMLDIFERGKERRENKAAAGTAAPHQSVAAGEVPQDTSVQALRQLVDTNVAALNFEPKLRTSHDGWSRLDLVVGQADAPTSWIGGLPEMPSAKDWPVTNGKAAMFLAQIAMSDLPDTIWGGMAPKTGWLLFFVAPDDWGGGRVIHVDHCGSRQDYPNGASVENYLSLDMREKMESLGRSADTFRPLKFALTVSATHANPPNLFQHLETRDQVRDKYNALERTDPDLAPFAVGPNPTHLSIEMLALKAYMDGADTLAPRIRKVFESIWNFQASVEAASMGGPVGDDFFYTTTEEPVVLLRLQSSKLLGWSFGSASSLGVFIAPDDLKEGRWNKAWFSIAN